jgi:hypothetical protein
VKVILLIGKCDSEVSSSSPPRFDPAKPAIESYFGDDAESKALRESLRVFAEKRTEEERKTREEATKQRNNPESKPEEKGLEFLNEIQEKMKTLKEQQANP